MFTALVAAKQELLATRELCSLSARQSLAAAFAEEQIRFAVAKELLEAQPKAMISQEALVACAEADEAMDRLQAAIQRVEQLESN